MVPKVFLRLGIQGKINIANCKERPIRLRLLGFEKKANQKTCNNLERPAMEMDIQGK